MYGTIIVGPDKYQVLIPFETTYDGGSGHTTFSAEGQMRAVILCEHCRNFRLEPIVAYNWDQVVELGWVVKMPKED